MRRILIDYARARTADKRKGERVSLTAVEDELTTTPSFEELLAIDRALAHHRVRGLAVRARVRGA